MQEFSATADNISRSMSVGRQTRRIKLYTPYGKRAFDLFLALILAPVVAPVIGALWLITRRDGGPGFFGHERVGMDGKLFKCWKIRTMVVDAEAQLQKLLAEDPAAAAEWARDQKLTNDPRINRFGHFLRKTSLDELPQIWNVLLGEMSFVGPRPVVTSELAKYGEKAGAYLAQKPGITGLWQVSGRNDLTYENRVMLDFAYFKKPTFSVDVTILARTIPSVLFKTGR